MNPETLANKAIASPHVGSPTIKVTDTHPASYENCYASLGAVTVPITPFYTPRCRLTVADPKVISITSMSFVLKCWCINRCSYVSDNGASGCGQVHVINHYEPTQRHIKKLNRRLALVTTVAPRLPAGACDGVQSVRRDDKIVQPYGSSFDQRFTNGCIEITKSSDAVQFFKSPPTAMDGGMFDMRTQTQRCNDASIFLILHQGLADKSMLPLLKIRKGQSITVELLYH